MRLQFAALALLIGTTACSTVNIGEHTAASNYEGSPQRIFILNQLDNFQHKSLPEDFATAIEPALAKCNVEATVYRPNSMELDAEAKLRAAVQLFKPDAVLSLQLTHRLFQGMSIQNESYTVTLYDALQKRQVWHEEIYTRGQMGFPYKDVVVGSLLADQLLRTMAADNIIKTCPPFPPE